MEIYVLSYLFEINSFSNQMYIFLLYSFSNSAFITKLGSKHEL